MSKAGWVAVAFGAIFGIVGLSICIYGLNEALQAEKTGEWPSVMGVIESAEMRIADNHDRDASFRPEFQYRYEVDGRKFTGTRLFPVTDGSGSPATVRRRLNEFEPGSEVDVFYDPADPSEAVLRPIVPGAAWTLVFVGVAFAAIGLVVAGLVIRVSHALQQGPSRKHTGSGRKVAAGVFGALTIAGGILVWFGVPMLMRAGGSPDWPTADGQVIVSKVVRHESDEGEDTFAPQVVYDYEVQGITHTGDRIWFGQGGDNMGTAQKTVRQYPVGKNITVYFEPEDPWESVLQPGRFASTWVMAVLGSVLLLIGVAGLFGTVAVTLSGSSKLLVEQDAS